MATIIRVKRSCTDEPLDSLIIACKKQKTSDGVSVESKSEDLKALLKFAGTVQNQENTVEQIAKTLKKEQFKDHLKETFKQPKLTDTTAKTRVQIQEKSKENRYKVVNCFRSLDPNIKEIDENGMTVIDVEDSGSCSINETSSNDKNTDYVYDLYVSNTSEDLHQDYESLLMYMQSYDILSGVIEDTHSMTMYRDRWEGSEDICESEDSNSESNWRNDYPDEEEGDEDEDRMYSDNSIDEMDMINAMGKTRVDDEYSCHSGDSADEPYVYAVDDDNFMSEYQMNLRNKYCSDGERSDDNDDDYD